MTEQDVDINMSADRIFFDDVFGNPPTNIETRVSQVRGAGYYRVTQSPVEVDPNEMMHKWIHDFEGGNERCEVCDDVKWAEAGFRSLLPYHKQQL